MIILCFVIYSTARVLAIAKRLLQLSLLSEPNFICAALYLFSHLIAARPYVFSLVTSTESDDASEIKEGVAAGKEKSGEKAKAKEKKKDVVGIGAEVQRENEGREREYDARKRDPKYAGGEFAKAWEISQLVTHYHPSVV